MGVRNGVCRKRFALIEKAHPVSGIETVIQVASNVKEIVMQGGNKEAVERPLVYDKGSVGVYGFRRVLTIVPSSALVHGHKECSSMNAINASFSVDALLTPRPVRSPGCADVRDQLLVDGEYTSCKVSPLLLCTPNTMLSVSCAPAFRMTKSPTLSPLNSPCRRDCSH